MVKKRKPMHPGEVLPPCNSAPPLARNPSAVTPAVCHEQLIFDGSARAFTVPIP